MTVALITNYLAGYRLPLYERLAERFEVEVLCFGGGERYVPSWFADLDRQLAEAPFPARRLSGPGEAFRLAGGYDATIAPFAGGAVLPAAYFGAKRARKPFVLWASVWARPRSPAHDLAYPVTRHIYRHADAVIAYGEHVKRFVAAERGHADDVFVAPQAVEPELFGRPVSEAEVAAFRSEHGLPDGPLVVYVGRLVAEKGVEVLLDAWRGLPGTLVFVGEGPLAARAAAADRVRVLAARPRAELAVVYAASEFTVLPSIPTPRFKEPWGLVCNESMHQGRPVVVSDAVGAAAGGLVRDGVSGLVVPAGDAGALRGAIDGLLSDEALRGRLGVAARTAVADYTYDAMVEAFGRALSAASIR